MTGYVSDPATLLAARLGDDKAMAQVVESNLGLVKSIALRFAGRGVELEDLIQIGTVGMLKAVRGFDAGRECRFSTYAVPHIAGEIRRFFRDDGWIKVSRSAKSNAAKLRRAAEEYEKEYGREPSLAELCEGLGISYEDAVFALDATRPAVSLYGDGEREEKSPEEILGEDPTEGIVTSLALSQAVASLPEEEKKLVILRYGKGLTQVQTAAYLGVSQVKVSRWESRILLKLKDFLKEQG